ncbi:zinc dependent phospholipase C family protein [Persicitalea sp.]|uniref:zinc dependent phospholipase C family protein n=1 Tax=Persicitalea sp. TaxID=3100273 RepID=UPI0035946D76
MKISLSVLLLAVMVAKAEAVQPQWGFWAHKRINRLAVFRLPPEMQFFYKKNIDYITENAVNPDRRRYAVVGEAERHFIDLDVYGDSALTTLPLYWNQAKDKIGEDSLRMHGIVPWYVQTAVFQLTEAMRDKSAAKILRISADLGHYVADANVPLHTTRNYNGQLTGQEGIHAFWESRIPEKYAEDYELWIGTANYIENPARAIWGAVAQAHAASDSVLRFEKVLSKDFKADRKFTFVERNKVLVRTYSDEFTAKYNEALEGQVERQMKNSVQMVSDLWYTSWVNAGQPDLRSLANFKFSEADKVQIVNEQQTWLQRLFKVRAEGDN